MPRGSEGSSDPFADPNRANSRSSRQPPSSYQQVAPLSPSSNAQEFGLQPMAPADSSRPSKYVSSPLNPNASVSSPNSASLTRPPSWSEGSDGTHVNNGNGPSGQGARTPETRSSNSSANAEKDNMRNIMAGSVGGTYSPYPSMTASTRSTQTSTFRGSKNYRGASDALSPPQMHRFSTGSSVGSVLSFMTDSKYASSTAALPVYKDTDADPRASFLPADNYGVYERLGGPADDDDFIHEPGTKNVKIGGTSWRGFLNVSALVILLAALITLFVGYPVISFHRQNLLFLEQSINGTGQLPKLPGFPSLVDRDTDDKYLHRKGFDGHDYDLVFSDEFNRDGRSFYPGDDPFWEAVDLHYYATGDLEWYDPGQVTTRDGHLSIVLEQVDNHNLHYKSGMLQSWNKFCFTTGYIEVAVSLPGTDSASGYWPGAWLMGNLARPGYGASTDGTWPYTYDSCDAGTFPNQTDYAGQPSAADTAGGIAQYNDNISWLPGQRLSACTCPGSDHPGPDVNHPIGRGAPEIDILEVQKNRDADGGQVSQSVQLAPMVTGYNFPTGSNDIKITNPQATSLNTYKGSALQQAISAVTNLNSSSYNGGGNQFTKFGFEYWSDPGDRQAGYIQWVADQPSFKIEASTFGPDSSLNVSQRLISEEPMAIVFDLALSPSFQTVDLSTLSFPAELQIDYVRVYQRKGVKNGVTCDPPNRPTADYIARHLDVYSNPNLTTWGEAGLSFPYNKLLTGCP